MQNELVVVITGASSGIGRSTALKFARHGNAVVLASRNRDALEDLTIQCEAVGGAALSVPTDVTSESAVSRLARKALREFDRIDIWINNAGVSAFGRIDELPADVCRRVIEVNLMGVIYGSRAAVSVFREQRCGVLINLSSVLGGIGKAYTSIYSASKAAIIALDDSLRQELADEPDIHVCTVQPASIDTPLFQHAANYTGRLVRPIPPVYPPEKVAETLFSLAHCPRRRTVVGSAGKTLLMFHEKLPGTTERVFRKMTDRTHFLDVPCPATDSAVFEPPHAPQTVTGGWRTSRRPHKKCNMVAMAGAAAAGFVLYKAWSHCLSREPECYCEEDRCEPCL